MKRISTCLLALVLVLLMVLVAQPSEAMAVSVQKAQVQQPSKAITMESVATQGVLIAQIQPSKQDVLTAIAQPSKEQVLAEVRAGATAGDTTADTVTSCSLCFTCGSSWPSYSGYIPLPAGSQPGERGSGCSGTLQARADTAPYICCHTSP